MQKVLNSVQLMEKVLYHCNTHVITTIAQISKQVNPNLFCIIDEYTFKKLCKTHFGNHTNLSWYDLYAALSNENRLKKEHSKLRKRYIEVANCCKCRIYCKVCSKPITETSDISLCCPNCKESFGIDEFDITFLHIDYTHKRGMVSSQCSDCRQIFN